MLIFSIFDKVLVIFDARLEFNVKNYSGFMVQTWIARCLLIKINFLGSQATPV